MVGSGPGGLLYPYVVRGYRKSTSPAQELFGHRRGRLTRPVVGLPLEPTESAVGARLAALVGMSVFMPIPVSVLNMLPNHAPLVILEPFGTFA